MSRIETTFKRLKEKSEGALVVFTVAGHPSREESEGALAAIADAGADVVELGIPFSDPLADGPAIQAASQRALEHGVTPSDVLEMVRRFRAQRETPVVLMTCYNPICQYGVGAFARDARTGGVDGVIITDLPPEEAGEWVEVARACQIDTIFLLAPTSSAERMKKVVDLVTGFVYCISRMGVTGARAELPTDLQELVARIRRETDKPIAVGFGISRPAHVAEVCGVAEGAVVGSAVVSLIDRERGTAGLLQAVAQFVGELKAATRSRPGGGRQG
jgi:tryptophan synthase alpha chain